MAVKPAPLAKESVGLFKRGQKALLDRLQKMVDDGASKADLDKVAGNASKIKPGPGAIKRLKDTEARFIDWVTRQKRFKKGKSAGQPYSIGKGGGAVPKGAKDIRVKRGVARTIVYGGGATALGTAGNATDGKPTAEDVRDSTNPKGITDAEKARIMREAAKKEKEIRAGGIRSQDKANSKGKLFKKFRPFGGVLARALLGDDEKFGGERGAIDFIRLKKKKNKTPTEKEKMEVMMRANKKLEAAEKKAAEDVAKAKQKAKGLKNGGMAKKPVKKNMGGMMKKKGYANGGDVGSLDGLSEKELKQMIRRLKLKESLKKPKKLPKKPSPPVRGKIPQEERAKLLDRGMKKLPRKPRSRREQAAELMNLPQEKRSLKIPQEERSMRIPKEKRSFPEFSKGGAAKKKGYAKGGMTKKGYANGGMAKKGYANGGAAKKTASRGKARGVGAATRGYGKAMKK